MSAADECPSFVCLRWDLPWTCYMMNLVYACDESCDRSLDWAQRRTSSSFSVRSLHIRHGVLLLGCLELRVVPAGCFGVRMVLTGGCGAGQPDEGE